MKNSDIYSDVKLIKNKLNMELIEVLANEKEGTKEEQQKLQKIITELGDKIYIDAVYLLTHESLKNTYEAKEVFEDIKKNHRDSMSQLLNRVVTIQVAALDYIQNIRKIIKHPTIIDSDKYYQFVYNVFIDETTKTYEKKLLDSDLESEIEKALRWNLIFSIAFIDIDNLKDVNDSYGHLIGTKVVRFRNQSLY